ncbi:hypothetical protein MNEG_12377 [Monoraphidium neglectum]|uniref:Uncharacterized protein n=1 Tax=Monoraphidium neglectum TaxID=145388 RepID=A0A0D2M2J3_9CHLO|nr:hypothetical protein MNEG_12377 [Monoraphidium neglectum]KIY95586.1 hypothetical protein MNEG_12377 [Monoraphidium neglectum]|eukprot:XP_013894606.1 hypothetical protein MNEG_12377 [Monoraphidium neglectum]
MEAAAAALALGLLSTLAALLDVRLRQGDQGSGATCAREAATAAFGAMAKALRGPLRQEPDLVSDAARSLVGLARCNDAACAAAASTPHLAAALAAALAGGLLPNALDSGGGGDAAAGAGTELQLQCASLISRMLTVKSIELRTQVAHEVADVPGVLAALVRLLANPNPTTAADTARALSLIANLTPAARGAIMRLPVLAALGSTQ